MALRSPLLHYSPAVVTLEAAWAGQSQLRADFVGVHVLGSLSQQCMFLSITF